jgi:hypothetical protein
MALDTTHLRGEHRAQMNLFPAYFGARKRDDDVAPPEPDNDSRADVFRLIPPRAETLESSAPLESFEPAAPEPPAAPESGRDVHPVGAMDLSRLSIDNDGRLYWDGKPVEVRRRLLMSPAQIFAALIIGLFVMIAGIGAAVQGTATAHEWACRIGWTEMYCKSPAPAQVPAPRAPARLDIPT